MSHRVASGLYQSGDGVLPGQGLEEDGVGSTVEWSWHPGVPARVPLSLVMSVNQTPDIEVEAFGTIDERDSAYPQATVLQNGDILCSFSNAGGSSALGGTDWARSTDGGRTWRVEGTILPPGGDPPTTNFLKLSRASDAATVFAYGARFERTEVARFGERTTEAILCVSEDDGRHWSLPRVVPIPGTRLEITHGILALPGSRLLAPAASIVAGRPGERVVAAVSTDGGATWPELVEVFRDPAGERGYLEHKLTDLGEGHLLATAWTIRMADVVDLPNSYVVSHDAGATWSTPREADTHGQTLSTVALGEGWLLAFYNRRTSEPGIVAAVVRLDDDRWVTMSETLAYASVPRSPGPGEGGIDRFSTFGFGFPTAVRLSDGRVLATFWTRDGDRTAVRWMRLRVSVTQRPVSSDADRGT